VLFVSNHFLEKKTKNHGFFGFFPSEGIASDATWMYYVKKNKNHWFKPIVFSCQLPTLV
jgi:hypothetical protein